ncbi:MAG TPA: hypothetical protein DEP87_01205 [Candidatus Pacebacteria bacterium]|nr:hypothetical protein [Candidatus Paceibacterota bacterium]
MPVLPILPHQLTDHVKLLHKVAVVHDDKVLILKRANTAQSRPGCWDLPGGNSEWPVALTENTANIYQLDIVREIQEETGSETSPNNFSEKNLIFFRTFFEPERQVYSLICGWKLNAVTDLTAFSPEKVKLSPEHTQMAWISLSEAASYDFGGVRGQFILEIIVQALKI